MTPDFINSYGGWAFGPIIKYIVTDLEMNKNDDARPISMSLENDCLDQVASKRMN